MLGLPWDWDLLDLFWWLWSRDEAYPVWLDKNSGRYTWVPWTHIMHSFSDIVYHLFIKPLCLYVLWHLMSLLIIWPFVVAIFDFIKKKKNSNNQLVWELWPWQDVWLLQVSSLFLKKSFSVFSCNYVKHIWNSSK